MAQIGSANNLGAVNYKNRGPLEFAKGDCRKLMFQSLQGLEDQISISREAFESKEKKRYEGVNAWVSTLTDFLGDGPEVRAWDQKKSETQRRRFGTEFIEADYRRCIEDAFYAHGNPSTAGTDARSFGKDDSYAFVPE